MMKRTGRSIFTILLPFSILVSSCAAPAVPATTTSTPLPAPSDTATSVPTDTPAPTDTPEPTAVPGVEVIPITDFTRQVPWLARDEAKLPLSCFYGFNLEKAPFDNVLVRQAFAAAIDRQLIAEQALGYYFPGAVPATTLTPATILGRDLYNQVGIPFDPERAKELFKVAGYGEGGKEFPQVTLLVSTRGKGAPGAYYQMAKTAAGMWKEHLGVEVIVEAPELAGWRARVDAGDFDMHWLGWVADYDDPDNFLNMLFRTGVEFNWIHFSNAEFDDLVVQARKAHDPLERQLLYIQAERILTEEQTAILPLFHAYRPTPYVY